MFQVFFCFLKGYNCEKLQLFFTVKSFLSFYLFVRLFTLNVYSIHSIGDHCYHFIWWLLKLPSVFFVVLFAYSTGPSRYEHCFQQPFGWTFFGLALVAKQFGLQLAVLAVVGRWILLSFPPEIRRDVWGIPVPQAQCCWRRQPSHWRPYWRALTGLRQANTLQTCYWNFDCFDYVAIGAQCCYNSS